MLTNNEITALNLSPTKKDFVQIWNELLEVAGRLSERWDPTSTNESDPGIVILKALTGIADKLNYNIDKNILEAFMPTAAQEDSMRKLCDMLGYNVKYYRSAETTVTVKYHNSDKSASDPDPIKAGLLIPKFTVITNSDQDVNYFTTEPVYISTTNPSVQIKCMEGQIVKCESTTDNYVITSSQISDNNRFYLPEYQIAENGIFVYNVVANSEDGDVWKKVDNLNIQMRGTRVFKFGYDSYAGRPYLEFPDDYSELINDGLFIYYARTSGADGNISVRALTQIELPNSAGWDSVSADNFSAENAFSATTGSNIETIGQAYNSFKKTVGTFETLVTCRDYMNYIYNMTSDSTGKYLVSNALVTDMRTDLNRAVTICSCDDAGIFYRSTPLADKTYLLSDSSSSITSKVSNDAANKPVFNPNRSLSGSNWFLGSADGIPLIGGHFIDGGSGSGFDSSLDGEVSATDGVWCIKQNNVLYKTILPIVQDSVTTTNTNVKTVENRDAISHFDLVLYPYKSYNQIRSNVRNIQEVYDKSFEYASEAQTVKSKLDQSDVKTIAHNIVLPRERDIISINNYLRLNAIIGTTTKVTVEEGELLIDKIKIALANAFNMHELDFGEEIPFDSILSVIENADARISVVSLAEPALYTTFSVYEGVDKTANPIVREYAVASDWLSESYANESNRFEHTSLDSNGVTKYSFTFDTTEAKKIYNRLAVRNVLAGRIPLFKYNTTFKTSFSDGAYKVTDVVSRDEVPSELDIPSAENTSTIYTKNNIVYAGQFSISPSGEQTITYTKTYTPEEYSAGTLAKTPEDDANYTELEAKCEILTETDQFGEPTQKIFDVNLADGEFVKFRAPNFITNKTYPAYVNYRLVLNSSSNQAGKEAIAAKAKTLYSLLASKNSSGETWRDALFTYFKNSKNKKKFTLTQVILGKTDDTMPSSGGLTLKLENSDLASTDTTSQILDRSGFVKLVSGKARIESADGNSDINSRIVIPELYLYNDYETISEVKQNGVTKYILNDGIFNNIKTYTDIYLNSLDVNTLPDSDWTISYDFEYVPFDISSLSEWLNFVKSSTSRLGFSPVTESGTALWRVHQGSYSLGKYVLSDSEKLLVFTGAHFGLLDANRLDSVYVVEDLGRDATLDHVPNDEEYQLRSGEYLYIEYTPSTTAEDGTTKTQEAVKEVLTEGAIIKPSGFDGDGVLSADAMLAIGKTEHKKVTFGVQDGAPNSGDIGMYSLGANEQIAVRELSKVTLDYSSLSESPTIYVYKNFSGCDELEKVEYDDTGKRRNNSYTLKDGEYIFYTDENKSEFAYYTSGTRVTLDGRSDIVIPKRDTIDISTIFDSGIKEIPWAKVVLGKNDAITFQEFQYITLGPNDTLKSLVLYDASASKLTSEWQKCSKAEYEVYGSGETTPLKPINLTNASGNGWEVCSILELNASPTKSQTLRNTDKVKTSVDVYKTSTTNLEEKILVNTIQAKDSDHPISFKSNVACVSSNGKLNIKDTYSSVDAIKSIELKVMSEQKPAIIKTAPGKLTPFVEDTGARAYSTSTVKTFSNKSYDDLFTRVPLTDISAYNTDGEAYDNALLLSVNVLPNTCGIFSIYLKYGKDAELTDEDIAAGKSPAETWIELLPGSYDSTIELLGKQTVGYSGGKLKLHEGVNCIRVNRTCDIYIKTSFTAKEISNENAYENNSISTLYFDELRLVDCQPIEYIENGEKKLQNTQGLNLAQIGYLDTADSDPLNSFDLQIRRNIRKEYTENALAALDTRRKLEDSVIGDAEVALQEDKLKLQNLVDFLHTAKTEITALLDNTEDYVIDELFEKYNELCVDLKQEEDLLKALTADKNVVELEKKLNNLLAELGSGDEAKQELLAKLDALDLAAMGRASVITSESLSKGVILDDFEAAADDDNKQLISDLKLFSISAVNDEYSAKLEKLTDAISQISNDEAKAALLAILDDINIAKHEKLVAQIQELLGAKQEELMNLLDDVKVLANGELDAATGKYTVNYVLLRVALTSLLEHLIGADIANLLSRLDIISNSSMENSDKYQELIRITNELEKLLSSEGEAVVGNYAAIVTDINSILESVKSKISANSTVLDSSIVASIDSLYTDVDSIYVKQLTSLLTDLQSTLSTIEDNYLDAIDKLDDRVDIQAVLSKLDSYKTARLDQIKAIEEFGSESIKDTYMSSLPYGTPAVVSVWPAYMKRAYIIGIASLYRDIRMAINAPDAYAELELDANFYAGEDMRPVLTSVANVAEFKQLFDQTKNLAIEYAQGAKRLELVNTLGTLITPSTKLTEAFETISNDGDYYADRNSVLKQLVTTWLGTTDIAEKQRLLDELISELNSVIYIDTALVNICANLLCPSVLLFPETSGISDIEDDFYDRLNSYISDQKANLADTVDSLATYLRENVLIYINNAHAVTESLLSALENRDIKDFEYLADIAPSDESSTLLTYDYLDKLAEIKASLGIREQIDNIRSSKLLSLLQKDLIVAWQDKLDWVDSDKIERVSYNWLDSCGEYYQKLTNYLNTEEPARWVAYPSNGTSTDRVNWLQANGQWTLSNGDTSIWKTNKGLMVGIDAKREYNSSVWLDGNDREIIVRDSTGWLTADEEPFNIIDAELEEIIDDLLAKVTELGQLNYMSDEAKNAHSVLWLETQLLNEIRELDRNGEFYYNAPIETSVAIDFHESDSKLNTLMNPAVNYDINNINNNFVISKLDINYLTNGLQIARSSKLS